MMALKNAIVCSLLAVTGLLVTVRPSYGAVQLNQFIPFFQVFELCDDEVAVAGDLHVLATFTQDPSGGIHVQLLAQPTAVSGFSLITDEEFIGGGATVDNINFFLDGDGTETVRSEVILVGEDGSVYVSLIDFHITVANGEAKVLFADVVEAVCL